MRREAVNAEHPVPGQDLRAGSWWTAHAVEVVFAGLIGAAFVYLVRLGSKMYFLGDDWPLLHQAGTLSGMLEPYNGHPSVAILALYRTLIELFGFSYWPFRVASLLCLLAIPVTYFMTTRRLLTPPLAAVAALSLVSYSNLELSPSWLNHYLVLVGGIVCAAALNRGRRADWVVAGALALSFSAAGGGVAVAAACLVHNACTGASRRRWLAVLGPCVLWGAWRLTAGEQQKTGVAFTESLRFAGDVASSPFEHLGLGNRVLAACLLAAFVAYGVWVVRHGLVAASNFLSWLTAMGVWTAGLAYSRGPFLPSGLGGRIELSFRYELLALGFALLAIVPRRPIRWPTRFPLTTNPRWVSASAVVILAATLAGAITAHDEVTRRAEVLASYTDTTKGYLVVMGLGPEVIRDEVIIRPPFFWLDAEGVRTVLRREGQPFPATAAESDQRLVDVGAVTAQPVDRTERSCRSLTEPISWRQQPQRPLYLWSDQAAWTISVRRFGSDWIEVARPKANQVVEVSLPTRAVDEPWLVQADGACRVPAPPTPASG